MEIRKARQVKHRDSGATRLGRWVGVCSTYVYVELGPAGSQPISQVRSFTWSGWPLYPNDSRLCIIVLTRSKPARMPLKLIHWCHGKGCGRGC
jgi:hypothetical protein